MIRQAFRKLAAFMGLAAAFSIPTEVTRRPKMDTSIPRVAVKRRGPHGKMRVFRSYKTAI